MSSRRSNSPYNVLTDPNAPFDLLDGSLYERFDEHANPHPGNNLTQNNEPQDGEHETDTAPMEQSTAEGGFVPTNSPLNAEQRRMFDGVLIGAGVAPVYSAPAAQQQHIWDQFMGGEEPSETLETLAAQDQLNWETSLDPQGGAKYQATPPQGGWGEFLDQYGAEEEATETYDIPAEPSQRKKRGPQKDREALKQTPAAIKAREARAKAVTDQVVQKRRGGHSTNHGALSQTPGAIRARQYYARKHGPPQPRVYSQARKAVESRRKRAEKAEKAANNQDEAPAEDEGQYNEEQQAPERPEGPLDPENDDNLSFEEILEQIANTDFTIFAMQMNDDTPDMEKLTAQQPLLSLPVIRSALGWSDDQTETGTSDKDAKAKEAKAKEAEINRKLEEITMRLQGTSVTPYTFETLTKEEVQFALNMDEELFELLIRPEILEKEFLELSPEQIDNLINDMNDEEFQAILNPEPEKSIIPETPRDNEDTDMTENTPEDGNNDYIVMSQHQIIYEFQSDVSDGEQPEEEPPSSGLTQRHTPADAPPQATYDAWHAGYNEPLAAPPAPQRAPAPEPLTAPEETTTEDPAPSVNTDDQATEETPAFIEDEQDQSEQDSNKRNKGKRRAVDPSTPEAPAAPTAQAIRQLAPQPQAHPAIPSGAYSRLAARIGAAHTPADATSLINNYVLPQREKEQGATAEAKEKARITKMPKHRRPKVAAPTTTRNDDDDEGDTAQPGPSTGQSRTHQQAFPPQTQVSAGPSTNANPQQTTAAGPSRPVRQSRRPSRYQGGASEENDDNDEERKRRKTGN